ncbi:hypothetical protein SLE2022_341650 [Rubroshorea leprosula]
MSKWKEGGQRRSPRLSASDDAWKAAQQPRRVSRTLRSVRGTVVRPSQPQGPASRTRARKKRKLRPLEDVAATPLSPIAQQDDDQQSEEDHPIRNGPTVQGDTSLTFEDQAASPDGQSTAFTQWMPEKRVLEVVIDTLQRRDTYEIFAEPVDPEEVEDYYEIIKEPMDFGTMRAKLHEGMYQSLKQFEHDAFLISRNAMHFNSAATIYFRQARAIHELTKRVFHTLKADPEKFEMEFSETRRRTSRRLINEGRSPLHSSSSKLATNVRTRRMTGASSKRAPHLLATSNHRKSAGGSPGCTGNATVNARDNTMPSGSAGGGQNSLPEADRRFTYRPWTTFLNENDSIVSMVYNNSKLLTNVNQQDIGYSDSLMLFVKDLGPTAQMVARRKLAVCSVGGSNYWSPDSRRWFQDPGPSSSTPKGPTILDDAVTTSHSLPHYLRGCPTVFGNPNYTTDLSYAGECGKPNTIERTGICSSSIEVASSIGEKKIPGALRGDVSPNDAVTVLGASGRDIHQGRTTGTQLGSFSFNRGARDMNFSVSGIRNSGIDSSWSIMDKSKGDNQAQLLNSALKQPKANTTDFKLRSDYKSLCSWPPRPVSSQITDSMQGLLSRTVDDQDLARCTRDESYKINGSVDAGQASKQCQPLPLSSQFIFDLPFLQTRLNQINSPRKDKFFQQGLTVDDTSLEKACSQRTLTSTYGTEPSTRVCNDIYQQLSLDPQHNDLALQL